MLNLKSIIKITLFVLISIFMGLVTVAMVGIAHGSYLALLGFPALIILGMLFVFNRNLLFLIIIFSRASIDPFIESTKMGALGLGVVLNLLVIILAISVLPSLSVQLKKLLRDSWLVFCGVLFFAAFFSSDFINSLKISVNIIAGGAVFIMGLSLIKNEHDYARWLKIILLSSIIPIVYALSEKIIGNAQFFGSEGYRLQGTFYHPNVLGFYSVLMLSVCILIMKIDFKVFNKHIKNTIPLYIILIFAVLLFTKTRSAWVACFVFAFLYAVIFERKYLAYMLVIMGGALCIPEIQDRLLNIQEGEAVWGYGQLNSYTWRMQIWHDGLNSMSPSRYFFGYGLDSFKTNSVSFFTLSNGRGMGAHNIYVQLFFETGLFGLLAYVFMNFTLIKYFFKFYRSSKLLSFFGMGLIIEYALFAYSDNMFAYLSFNWSFWFVLGITIGYMDFKRKTLESTGGLESNSKVVTSFDIKRKN